MTASRPDWPFEQLLPARGPQWQGGPQLCRSNKSAAQTIGARESQRIARNWRRDGGVAHRGNRVVTANPRVECFWHAFAPAFVASAQGNRRKPRGHLFAVIAG